MSELKNVVIPNVNERDACKAPRAIYYKVLRKHKHSTDKAQDS